jgi:hypothetical protein
VMPSSIDAVWRAVSSSSLASFCSDIKIDPSPVQTTLSQYF